MKKIFTYIFTVIFLVLISGHTFAQCGAGQSELYLTTSGGSYTSEKWVDITTGSNSTGTTIWA